jgi:hypothetical protein
MLVQTQLQSEELMEENFSCGLRRNPSPCNFLKYEMVWVAKWAVRQIPRTNCRDTGTTLLAETQVLKVFDQPFTRAELRTFFCFVRRKPTIETPTRKDRSE